MQWWSGKKAAELLLFALPSFASDLCKKNNFWAISWIPEPVLYNFIFFDPLVGVL